MCKGAIFPVAWGAIFPVAWGAKIPEGVPISLGNLAWGCQILGGARSTSKRESAKIAFSYNFTTFLYLFLR